MLAILDLNSSKNGTEYAGGTPLFSSFKIPQYLYDDTAARRAFL